MKVKSFETVLDLCSAGDWFKVGNFVFSAGKVEVKAIDDGHVSAVCVNMPVEHNLKDCFNWDFATLRRILDIAKTLGVEDIEIKREKTDTEEYIVIEDKNGKLHSRVDSIGLEDEKIPKMGLTDDGKPTIGGERNIIEPAFGLDATQLKQLVKFLKVSIGGDGKVTFKIENSKLMVSASSFESRRFVTNAVIDSTTYYKTTKPFSSRANILIKLLSSISSLGSLVCIYHSEAKESPICIMDENKICRYYLAPIVDDEEEF